MTSVTVHRSTYHNTRTGKTCEQRYYVRRTLDCAMMLRSYTLSKQGNPSTTKIAFVCDCCFVSPDQYEEIAREADDKLLTRVSFAGWCRA